MRKLIIKMLVAGAALASGYAVAQIVPALPFQLQNNTLADATQVMANFNQILNNTNANAAKNGANSDITSLLGLTTPIAPSVGGTTTWTGGTSTGSANAQVAATVVPSTFTLALGTHVVFKAGFSNTGPSTLNVASTGAKELTRRTQLGLAGMVGGEIKSGDVVEVVYDGATFQLLGYYAHVGAITYSGEGAVPTGWGPADGSCVPQTGQGVALFSAIGTGWGSCSAGNFALPDLRGRTPFAPDGGANRITNGGSGCTAVLTAGCGAQNTSVTVAQANLPSVNFTVTDPRTFATAVGVLTSGGATAPAAGALTAAATSIVSVTPSGGPATAASGGSGTVLTVTTLPPALIMLPLVKY